MNDTETENLLYKYFDINATGDEIALGFDHVTFSSVGESKNFAFIPKLSGTINAHVSSQIIDDKRRILRIDVVDDDGNKLIDGQQTGASGQPTTFSFTVRPFHRYILTATCQNSNGVSSATTSCSFYSKIAVKANAYMIKG